ncbi:MAG: DUF4860 domain-containing protein [Clostridiales bacterium]|nr:DUF4860 domain-containing protein [Clostridiales bacterium]
MKYRTQRKHAIDLIFPIALFFVFAVSALAVILIAADIYRSNTSRSQERSQTRISLSYITEKIRQNDAEGMISIGSLGDRDSLVLKQEINDAVYVTYIYEYEGMLKELFIKDGVEPLPENGKDIIEISSFSMEQLSDGLFTFTAVSSSGLSDSITIGSRSHDGEDTP